jgi:t-SNARE complex subunit (syntaxin)
MDYTKFIRSSNKSIPFKLNSEFPLIEEAMNMLKDFNDTQQELSNFFKINSNIDLDENYDILQEEKNAFIEKLSAYIKSNKLSKSHLLLLQSILSIINRRFDDLAMQYKLIKQKVFKQTRRLQLFNFNKLTFTKAQKENNKLLKDIKKTKDNEQHITTSNKQSKTFIDTSILNDNNSLESNNNYKESGELMNTFMNSANKQYEKTKQILFELSDLMTTVQKKIFEQSEMTKNILFNSETSVQNVEEGNKHLVKAQEYQKGRGVCIGMIFIILGLFLLFYDYTI